MHIELATTQKERVAAAPHATHDGTVFAAMHEALGEKGALVLPGEPPRKISGALLHKLGAFANLKQLDAAQAALDKALGSPRILYAELAKLVDGLAASKPSGVKGKQLLLPEKVGVALQKEHGYGTQGTVLLEVRDPAPEKKIGPPPPAAQKTVLHAPSQAAIKKASDQFDVAAEHFQTGVDEKKSGSFVQAAHGFLATYRTSPSPVLLFDAAQSYKRANEETPNDSFVDAAIQLYQRYLKDEPDGARVAEAKVAAASLMFDKAAALFSAGRYAEAAEMFLKSDELVPSPAHAFNVAQACRRANEASPNRAFEDKAVAYYEAYLKKDPTGARNKEARVELASILFDRAAKAYTDGKYLEAAQGFAECNGYLPSPELSFDLGQCYAKLAAEPEYKDKAIAAYEAYLAKEQEGKRADEAKAALAKLR